MYRNWKCAEMLEWAARAAVTGTFLHRVQPGWWCCLFWAGFEGGTLVWLKLRIVILVFWLTLKVTNSWLYHAHTHIKQSKIYTASKIIQLCWWQLNHKQHQNICLSPYLIPCQNNQYYFHQHHCLSFLKTTHYRSLLIGLH